MLGYKNLLQHLPVWGVKISQLQETNKQPNNK